MNTEQIYKELNVISNDNNITTAEKKMYLAIFNAELERQKYNEYINKQKQDIQKLRIKIIDDIMNIYANLDEQRKEVADSLLSELGLGAASTSYNFKYLDDFVDEYKVSNETLNGATFAIYLDNNIHKEIDKIKELEQKFQKSIERKFTTLEDKLSGVIDSRAFNFTKDDDSSEYKSESEFNAIYIKENEKIGSLDIGAKEKGILRNILLETIKYGKSYGTMYGLFPDLTEYIDEMRNRIISETNGKSM